MTEFHIVYVGAEGVGCNTSLVNIFHATRSPLKLYANSESHFIYPKDTQHYHMFVIRAKLRAWRVYDHPLRPELGDPLLDKQFAQEMNYLCQCDGILFVIDSEIESKGYSLNEFALLKRDFTLCGVDIDAKPIVFQANKRDFDNICSMEWVKENFRTQRCDYVESIATQGIGTLEAIDKLINLML
jgi:hypothetical protein